MKTSEVVAYLDSRFHPEYQEDYDNCGFLLGDRGSEYTGTLVALDLTEAVVAEAIAEGLSLIVTHHPFIFTGVKRLTDRTATGRMVMQLARHGISVYAAHTNLDNLLWGVNGALAAKLGLVNTCILKPFATDASLGAGMVGELAEPVAVEDFLKRVKTVIEIPFIRVSPLITHHSSPITIKRVAICGGSGAEFIAEAERAGADIYLTADLKYHDFQRPQGSMLLADIGHYESEQFAKDVLFSVISEKFNTFACRISASQKGIVSYI